MKMRMHCSSWRAVAPLALAVVVFAGLAPTPIHRSDNFNNNSFANFWSTAGLNNKSVDELNGRLEFHNTGPTGSLSAAGLSFNPYGINWKKDFHIEWNYKLNITNMPAPKTMFLGTALPVDGDWPATMTGFACGLLRDSGGLWAGVLIYNNGTVVDFDGIPITQTTGKIEIDWDYSADRMSVHRSGGPSAFIDGYYGFYGATYGTWPMRIIQGCATTNGNINFTGARVYMDNWEADFVKRNFLP